MTDKTIKKIDVHGSCVSRDILSYCDEKSIKCNSYFSRNCLVSAVMPPAELPVDDEYLLVERSEYQNRCMRYSIDKTTIPQLLQSESEYLMIDLFDLCQDVISYKNTTFSYYDTLFFNTKNYLDNKASMMLINFFDIPTYLWYGYIDIYFEKMMKFDNIILCRLQCCEKYISKSNKIETIPESKLAYGNAKYNNKLKDLEEYIIQKYDPFVLDFSKYFIANEKFNPDVTPVHFDELYYFASKLAVELIVQGNKQKYYCDLTMDIIAQILKLDIPSKEYLIFNKSKTSPFIGLGLLNSMFFQISDEYLLENRFLIGYIYEEAFNYFNKIENITLTNWLEFFNTYKIKDIAKKTKYLANILKNTLSNIEHIILMSKDDIKILFYKYLNDNDLLWIFILNVLYIIYPNDSEIKKLIKIYRNCFV